MLFQQIFKKIGKNLQGYNIKLTETEKKELKNAYGILTKGMGTLKRNGINLVKDGHPYRYKLT